MEIVAIAAGVTIVSLLCVAAWTYVRLEQHRIKYGNPEEIKELREEMAEYRRIIKMLDQEDLEKLEKRVAELTAQLRDSQVSRMVR